MSTSEAVLLVVHLLATAGMVGLIWFVQVVHYPLFVAVGADQFTAYESAHRFRTGFVVGPLMGVEAAAALWIAVDPPNGVGRSAAIVGLALLALIHASTVWLQVPAHMSLSATHDAAATRATIRRLVRTNWIRTAGWTARGVVAAAMVVVAN
jgi:hypothetical protein